MSIMNNCYSPKDCAPWKILPAAILLFLPFLLAAQPQQSNDSLLQQATVDQVIQYALKHHPSVQQSLLQEQSTENSIRSKLADWYPQVSFNYSYQHNFQLPSFIFNGNAIKSGVENTSVIQFSATQNIFNRDALLASQTARQVRTLTKQNTAENRILVAVNVAKAFYNVLATSQQINAAVEDTTRLGRSLHDAYNQYRAGVVDRTDFKRANIALNNAKALLGTSQEALKARVELLKTLMGYPVTGTLDLKYDSVQMEKDILFDTLQKADYNARIEYQLLTTQRTLQEATIKYNKWSFLPNLYASGAYNLNYFNNELGKLYHTNFPSSFAALNLSLPIFQGGKRIYNTRNAELQLRSIDWDLANLRNTVNSEYARAMADYKGSLSNYIALKENMALAREVYDVIQLQYRSGVKTYLEVITAETDLRTARINYFDALYQVLASKIDVLRALGQFNY